jgi:hypothetical protein
MPRALGGPAPTHHDDRRSSVDALLRLIGSYGGGSYVICKMTTTKMMINKTPIMVPMMPLFMVPPLLA